MFPEWPQWDLWGLELGVPGGYGSREMCGGSSSGTVSLDIFGAEWMVRRLGVVGVSNEGGLRVGGSY